MWSIASYPANVWYDKQFKITITGATPGNTWRIEDLTYPGGNWDDGSFIANVATGTVPSSTYDIYWRVRFPEDLGPRQFEIKGDGITGTSQVITINIAPLPTFSYPPQVTFNTEFSIEVFGAISGEPYVIIDWEQFYLNGGIIASGIAPASSFTIYCSPLIASTGPHEIRATFYSASPIDIAETEAVLFYINAITSTWNATVWPGQDARFFESEKRYQSDIARAGPAITFDQPLPRTITLNLYDLNFPEGYGLFPGWRVYIRNIYNISKFFSGTVVSWNRPLATLVVNVDHSENVEGYTVGDWTVDQDAFIAGEILEGVYPILIQDEIGPVTRNDLTYTQVDLGEGLLPSFLSINSSTGELEGTVPPGKMEGYTIGIRVTDGFRTQVVPWRFGGIVGPLNWGIAVLSGGGDRLSYPINSALPNGVARAVNRGLVSPNIFDYVWADGKDFLDANGNGTIDVALPTPNYGRYRASIMLKAVDESGVYEKFYNVGPDTFGNYRNSDLTWQGVYVRDFTSYKMPSAVPVVISAVTTTLVIRLGQPITPTSIVSATGGSLPLRYVLGPIGNGFYPNGYLNDGLTFNTSTGVISGTPTSLYGKTNVPGLGGDTFWINVTDGIKEADDNGAVFFTISGYTTAFTATTVLTTSTVIVGVPVSLTPVVANNAVGATTFAVAPSVPSGLSFSSSNGQITGTASTTSALTVYSVTVSDSDGSISTATFSLRVETSNLNTNLTAPSFTLSAGAGITPFTPVTHSGGYGTITYSVTPSLPANLILNTTNGQISGVPSAELSVTPFTIRVRDQANQLSEKTFNLTILGVFGSVVLVPNLSFSKNQTIDPVKPVEAIGGATPYTYSISPTLPTGLSYNASTGVITGTPTATTTTTNYAVTVTDSNSKVSSNSFTLRVEPLGLILTTSSVVDNSDYNDIQILVQDILGPGIAGYGYQASKALSTVQEGSNIVWNPWDFIRQDINTCTAHLTGSYFNYTTASVITAEFVNQLISNLNAIEYDRYNTPSQVATATTASVWTSTYVNSWGAYIDSTATITWAPGLDINYFFNLGGYLGFELDYLPSGATSNNLAWQTFIDNSSSLVEGFVYNRNSYLGPTTVTTSTTSTAGAIVLSVTKNTNTLTCKIQLTNSLVGTTDLMVRGTVKYTYSDSVLKAPLPRIIDIKEFNTGTFVENFIPVKSLRLFSTNNIYNWNVGSSSNVETVTIQNTGNLPVSVSGVTFTDHPSVDRIVNGTTNGNIGAFTVTTTSNYTFTLAYTGSTEGSFSSQFVVNAESPVGQLTSSTTQLIGAQPFSVSVLPSPVTTSTVGLSTWSLEFLLNVLPSNAELQYSAAFVTTDSPPGSAGWSIVRNNSSAGPISGSPYKSGPIISFSPIGTGATSYTATASLLINFSRTDTSGTASATVNITLNWTNPTTTYNLGSWVSPLAANNSVIGMSYDVLEGERYLTIGVGMGADGSVPLNVGGTASVDVANLGITADPDFKKGQRLYPVEPANQASDWSPFLKALGAWPNATPEQPYNIDVGITPTYRLYAPVAGDYSYEFSVDDDGFFALYPADIYGVNTGPMISLSPSLVTGGANTNWRLSYTGTVNLTAGWYLFRYYHINYSRKTAAAFQISDPSGNIIWNTRTPVRNTPNYLYWQDVMRIRIPANGTAKELYTSLWYVKNTYQVSNKVHWGYYFNPDMFKISDDGFGNLAIELFGSARAPLSSEPNAANDTLTIKMLAASFYYYLPPSTTSARYTNLDGGPVGDGTQTRYFTGFDASGNVTTVLQSIPATLPEPAPSSSGGGGGGGGDFFDPDRGRPARV